MTHQQRNVSTNKYSDLTSPVNPNEKIFLGKKLKVSKQAQDIINNLSGLNKMKLDNRLNNIVIDVVNHNLYNQRNIYLELSNSYLKVSVESTSAPYIGSITKAKILEKPRPLRPSHDEAKKLDDCRVRITRGLAKEIVKTNYQFEKVLAPNFFTAKELVNIQTLRMREHVKNWQIAGHTNRQWSDVCYGAKPGILNNGGGDEILALSAIFGISERTKLLSKSYFGSVKQTSVKRILHCYALIFGHPASDDDELQKGLSSINPYRQENLREYCRANLIYGSDVVIRVDNELNVHKFFRDGTYKFINCIE